MRELGWKAEGEGYGRREYRMRNIRRRRRRRKKRNVSWIDNTPIYSDDLGVTSS